MATSAITSSLFQQIESYKQQGRADVRALATALKNGDLQGAQAAFNDLAKLGDHAPGGNAPASSANPQAVQAFQNLGQALQSGDLSGAQSAFAALQSAFKNKGAALASSPDVIINIGQNIAASETESIYQQLQDFRNARKTGVASLGSALQSGDLNASRQAYQALVTLGENGPSQNGAVFQRFDRQQAFAAIGQALQSGDLVGAQQAFANLETTLHTPGNQVAPPTTQAPGIVPEVVINLADGNHGGPVPEVVINIGNNTASASSTATSSSGATPNPELVVNIASGSNGGQLTIDLSPLQGGQAGEQVKIDYTQGSNKNELIVNLFSAAANNQTSNALNLQA